MAASVRQVVQFDGAGGGSPTRTASFPSATLAGSAIVALFLTFEEDESGNLSITGVSDNKSGSYSNVSGAAQDIVADLWILRAYVAANSAGGSSHSVTITANQNSVISGFLLEIEGAATTSPVAGSNGASGSASSISGASVNPTANGIHLAMIVAGGEFPVPTVSAGTGWTENNEFSPDSEYTMLALMSRAASSGVSQSIAATVTNRTPDFWNVSHIVVGEGEGASPVVALAGFRFYDDDGGEP